MFVYVVFVNVYLVNIDIVKCVFGEDFLVFYVVYFVIKNVSGIVNIWVFFVFDLFVEDWEVVDLFKFDV